MSEKHTAVLLPGDLGVFLICACKVECIQQPLSWVVGWLPSPSSHGSLQDESCQSVMGSVSVLFHWSIKWEEEGPLSQRSLGFRTGLLTSWTWTIGLEVNLQNTAIVIDYWTLTPSRLITWIDGPSMTACGSRCWPALTPAFLSSLGPATISPSQPTWQGCCCETLLCFWTRYGK